jgi:hypothetical protein
MGCGFSFSVMAREAQTGQAKSRQMDVSAGQFIGNGHRVLS